jgi:non-homologous end joining protein Ku
VNPEELKLATQLINAITKPFHPEEFRTTTVAPRDHQGQGRGQGNRRAAGGRTGKIINLMEL